MMEAEFTSETLDTSARIRLRNHPWTE
jgi:hypothetical protein